MLNRDVNSRFEDWLLSPSETLDFEIKQWLDMSDAESHGIVAKALIALENHGGGFLLFGYKEDDSKKLVPDDNRPASLEPYLSDAINAILKKRAEPAFQGARGSGLKSEAPMGHKAIDQDLRGLETQGRTSRLPP